MSFLAHIVFFYFTLLPNWLIPKNEYQKIVGRAQGTTYSIIYEGELGLFKRRNADSIFVVIDKSMSLWDKSSTLSQINENVHNIKVDEHLKKVFEKSKVIYQQSSGAFDPTVGPIIKAYGFIDKNNLTPPTQNQIDSLMNYIGFDKVELKNHLISKSAKEINLDFNAIAQGYTVDILCEHLDNLGIQNYLVEVGGEIRSKGKNKEGKYWQVGIEKPQEGENIIQNEVESVLQLKNISLATSGSYRNYVMVGKRKISHILNPKTGQPAENGVISVSVLAPNCAEADAWATAFMVMQKNQSMKLAKKLGLEIQIVSNQKGILEIIQSKGFKRAMK